MLSVWVEQFVNGYLAVFYLNAVSEGSVAVLRDSSDTAEEYNNDKRR